METLDGVSLKLGVLAQDTASSGSSTMDTNAELQPTLGDLAQNQAPGTGQYLAKVRLYSAVLDARLGGFDLVSLTGYGVNDYQSIGQITSAFWGALAQSNFGVSGNTLGNFFRTEKFSQEIRLSSSIGKRVEWMARRLLHP